MTPARRLAATAGLSAMAVGAAVGGVSWYYADRLTEPPVDLWPPAPDPGDRVELIALQDSDVVLDGPAAARPGTWGVQLDGQDAYLQIHDEFEVDGDGRVRRVADVIRGEPIAGTGWLEAEAWPDDPSTLGLPVEDIQYDTPLGPSPAWRFPGDRSTWTIIVHGRSGRRREGLRAVPTFANLGLPTLAISYRNDPDGQRSPDGRSHLGTTEWEDVEAAVAHALDNGAEDVILHGYSMGGACCLAFARSSPLALRLRGMVLESPVLDWEPVVRRAAMVRGVPTPALPLLLPTTMALAKAWVGVDWERLRVADPDDLHHPKLLIHGDADQTVPVDQADALAAARPDIVTYLRVPGAGHGQSWNRDPDRYEETLRSFVTDVLDL